MESMGFVGLLATIVFIGMYMFPTPLQGKKGAKRLIIILCILCGKDFISILNRQNLITEVLFVYVDFYTFMIYKPIVPYTCLLI